MADPKVQPYADGSRHTLNHDAGGIPTSVYTRAEKPSILKDALKAIKPFLNRTTLIIALSLASAFGVLAPEKATQLRDVVMMLPQGTGDVVN